VTTALDVLRIAAGEIGYSRWDDPEEGTKYGRWYAEKHGSYFGSSGVPFCAMGASWVLDQAGITPPGGAFAYVPAGINAARAKNRLLADETDAQAGDLVCFDWDDDGISDHVGIVEFNAGSYLQTIEFNTSPGNGGSQGNGGGVYRRTRDWDSVTAVIRPDYDQTASTVGRITEDGYWGPRTTAALQEVLGTPIDGIVSSQEIENRPILLACTDGWEWETDPDGSAVIAAIQARLGTPIDGIMGPTTINALSARYEIEGDGTLSDPSLTVMALQATLNEGAF
jgi:peptidoglycan hydrolase-like protein with peptidoglycan-binding domain